mmetsp:Transcript_13972/g.18309  ORF Transcript_13972/g.18309 Transcript_13972/m.18309 type:complete len:236 (+) Transcript_13972:141-848(+)
MILLRFRPFLVFSSFLGPALSSPKMQSSARKRNFKSKPAIDTSSASSSQSSFVTWRRRLPLSYTFEAIDDDVLPVSPLLKGKSESVQFTLQGIRGGGFSDDSQDIAAKSSISSYVNNVMNKIGNSTEKCWVVLVFAIFIEILATTQLKTASDTDNLPKMCTSIALYILSLLCFAVSLKQIDVSVAYAIWSALGTAFVSIAGVCMFGEEVNAKKIISLIMIMVGVGGLNMQEDGMH